MRQCAADWCYLKASRLEPAAYYRRLRDLGYAGVEMVAPERYATARAAGLSLVTQSTSSMNEGWNRAAHHPRLLEELRAQIADARTERIANLIVFSGIRGGLSETAGIDACIAGLRQAAKPAEDAGVTLLLEVLNEFDHADQQCSRMAFAATVVEAVGSPRVRILYDCYHGARMGDACAQLPAHQLQLVGHVHLAACEGRTCPSSRTTPDYPPIVAHFLRSGYQGWWGQEFIPGADVIGELGSAFNYIAHPEPAVRTATA